MGIAAVQEVVGSIAYYKADRAMVVTNSNSVRDTWKLEHWDEYVKTIDYSIPEALKKMSSCLDLMLFYNSSDEEYQKSMEMVISRLEDE